MRKKIGNIMMFLGIMLVSAALFLFLYNQWDAYRAEKDAKITLDQLKEEIDSKDNKDNSNEEMKTIVIDGNEYIGYISIPAIDLELPVMSQWSYQGLKIAPGRFYGSTYGHNLVIAGHNYAKHFSSIKWLEKTTEVDFIDVENRVWSYQVSDIETLQPQQVDEMIEKTGNDNWDLTLFTCTTSGQTRCTVRCVLNQND